MASRSVCGAKPRECGRQVTVARAAPPRKSDGDPDQRPASCGGLPPARGPDQAHRGAGNVLVEAHIVAPNAGDIPGEAVLAVRFGLRVQEVVSTVRPYLTWGEGIKLVGQTFTTDVANLSCCASRVTHRWAA